MFSIPRMSTFQERFSQAFDAEARRRLEAGEPRLTKTMVWKAAGASSGAFTHWYNGSNGMDLDTCFLVAPLLRINPTWLFNGKGDRHPGTQQDPQPVVVYVKTPEPPSAVAELVRIAGVISDDGLRSLLDFAYHIEKAHPRVKQTPKSSV